MSNQDYWIEYHQSGRHLGAGFLVTRRYALTALHCLRGVAPEDDQLDVLLATGQTVKGHVCGRSPGSDLALILIPKNTDVLVPHLDRATNGEIWRSPYRPSKGHIYLSGEITQAVVTYQCTGGDNIEAMQLECYQLVDNYYGYSGGPVERQRADGNQAAIGILLEQYPDQRPSPTSSSGSSNVLFAATLAEAFRRFDCFDTINLLNILNDSPHSAANRSPSKAATQRISEPIEQESDPVPPLREVHLYSAATASSKLEVLRDWKERGLVSEQYAARMSRTVIRRFVDDQAEAGT